MNVTLFLFGVFFIIFRKQVAKKIIQSQNNFWGFNFGEREIQASEFVAVVVGFFLILAGFTSFL